MVSISSRTESGFVLTWLRAVLSLHKLILDGILERGCALRTHREAKSHGGRMGMGERVVVVGGKRVALPKAYGGQ